MPSGDPASKITGNALKHFGLRPCRCVDLNGDRTGFDIVAGVLGRMDAAAADDRHLVRNLTAQSTDHPQSHGFDQRTVYPSAYQASTKVVARGTPWRGGKDYGIGPPHPP